MIQARASLSIRMPSGRFPARSYERVLNTARVMIAQDSAKAFDRSADPVNWRPWPARKAEYPWSPLWKTGAMRQEVLKAVATSRITGNTLSVVLKHPKYARFHQKGTRKMAARRSVGVSLRVLNAARRALRAEGVRVWRGRA